MDTARKLKIATAVFGAATALTFYLPAFLAAESPPAYVADGVVYTAWEATTKSGNEWLARTYSENGSLKGAAEAVEVISNCEALKVNQAPSGSLYVVRVINCRG